MLEINGISMPETRFQPEDYKRMGELFKMLNQRLQSQALAVHDKDDKAALVELADEAAIFSNACAGTYQDVMQFLRNLETLSKANPGGPVQ